MFVYTIWDIALVGLLAVGIVVFAIGCIVFVVKDIAIKAGTKAREIDNEDNYDD